MQRLFMFLIALGAISYSSAANYAVIVAGSNGYYNYRHQADICHAYQILHKHGIPDENIVVFMYDDIAQNAQNPTKGIIINHPGGQDVYKGVPHDYTGATVTPTNFLNVLLGNKEALRGIGSGKVLESGPDDNVFIFYSDHGAVGLVAFPTGVLYAKDFIATINTMHTQNKYKNLVVYIEACESGSMLENLLAANINAYGTTASNAVESSYACYFDATRGTYLGDVYSVVWMEDSDVEDLNKESLFQQFTVCKDKTNTSHVMQYGDLTLGQQHNVGEFQGSTQAGASKPRNFLRNRYNDMLRRDAVAMEDVRLSIVSKRLAAADVNSVEHAELERELIQLVNDRAIITDTMQLIAATALSMNNVAEYHTVIEKPRSLTQHDCYKTVTQRVQDKCFDLPNEYVLNKLYIMANLCESGLVESTINQAVDQVCQQRLAFNY